MLIRARDNFWPQSVFLITKPFVNPFPHNDTFLHPWETSLSKQAISPFPTVFSTGLDNFLPFSSSLKLSSAKSFNLEESKIRHLVMG